MVDTISSASLPDESLTLQPASSLWRWVGAAAAVLAAAFGLFLFVREPGISAAAANGSYSHDCCGTLLLQDGRMSFGTEKSVAYVVERDGAGPYILPKTYVGPWEDRGFQIDGSRPPVKLRLDVIPRPNAIELYDLGRPYIFKRKVPRIRQAPATR